MTQILIEHAECRTQPRDPNLTTRVSAALDSRSGFDVLAAAAETREKGEEQLVREALRDRLRVARRVHLDEVEADDPFAPAELEERIHRLPGRQTARDGGASPRRIRELEAVDVERDIHAVDAAGRDLP